MLWCFFELCNEKTLYASFCFPWFHLLLAWLFKMKTKSCGRVLHEDSFCLTSSGHVIKPCSRCYPQYLQILGRAGFGGTYLACLWILEEATPLSRGSPLSLMPSLRSWGGRKAGVGSTVFSEYVQHQQRRDKKNLLTWHIAAGANTSVLCAVPLGADPSRGFRVPYG